MSEALYASRQWTSPDGLTLSFRDYAADESRQENRTPIICLHGLTRNARDFHELACVLAEDRRVIVPDMRGRGKSDYSSASSDYQIATYVADLAALREQEGIDRYIAIGTSMGGLMTMVQATIDPEPIAGVLLNDIGPVVDVAGLQNIRGYVGQGRSFPTWMHAARALAETHSPAHPTYDLTQWIAMAKRTMTLSNNGRIVFDYDMKIAEPILESDANAVPPDLWAGFEPLADRPVLLVRGALSNLLSRDTFDEMQRRAPDALAVTVAQTGHAPTLDEPEVREAISQWLAKID